MKMTMQVRVIGRVQGVGFRAWTQERATRLGLDGWVRNEPDGSVTALIAGDEAQLQTMLAELRRGPPGSAVADVVVVEDTLAVPGADFEVRR